MSKSFKLTFFNFLLQATLGSMTLIAMRESMRHNNFIGSCCIGIMGIIGMLMIKAIEELNV